MHPDVQGDVPKFDGETIVGVDPFSETYTSTGDARLQGRGRTVMRIGQTYAVPVE